MLCTRGLKCTLILTHNRRQQVLNFLAPLENGRNEISAWESFPKVTTSSHLLLGWVPQQQAMKSGQRKIPSGSPSPPPSPREDGGSKAVEEPFLLPRHRAREGARASRAGTSPIHCLCYFLVSAHFGRPEIISLQMKQHPGLWKF